MSFRRLAPLSVFLAIAHALPGYVPVYYDPAASASAEPASTSPTSTITTLPRYEPAPYTSPAPTTSCTKHQSVQPASMNYPPYSGNYYNDENPYDDITIVYTGTSTMTVTKTISSDDDWEAYTTTIYTTYTPYPPTNTDKPISQPPYPNTNSAPNPSTLPQSESYVNHYPNSPYYASYGSSSPSNNDFNPPYPNPSSNSYDPPYPNSYGLRPTGMYAQPSMKNITVYPVPAQTSTSTCLRHPHHHNHDHSHGKPTSMPYGAFPPWGYPTWSNSPSVKPTSKEPVYGAPSPTYELSPTYVTVSPVYDPPRHPYSQGKPEGSYSNSNNNDNDNNDNNNNNNSYVNSYNSYNNNSDEEGTYDTNNYPTVALKPASEAAPTVSPFTTYSDSDSSTAAAAEPTDTQDSYYAPTVAAPTSDSSYNPDPQPYASSLAGTATYAAAASAYGDGGMAMAASAASVTPSTVMYEGVANRAAGGARVVGLIAGLMMVVVAVGGV